jgi:hypothetical protein
MASLSPPAPVLVRLLALVALGAPLTLACERAVGGPREPAPGEKAAVPGEPSPIIGFDKTSHDFGPVPEGPRVSHRFKVKNSGAAPLEIKNVSATCGCTAAITKDKVIKPGGTGEIEVSFDTQGRPGKNVKTVSVSSNDPRTPTATLTINADVDRQLAFEPAESYLFGQAGQTLIAETWLAGKVAPRAKLKVAKVDPPGPLLVSVVDRKGEGGVVQRGLRFQTAPGQAGSGTVRVVLDTGLTRSPQITHLARWSVKGNLETPDAIFLDLADPAARSQVIQIRSSRADFRAKAATVLSGPFKAELITSAGNNNAWVKVTSTLTSPLPAPATGKLLLESNDPLQPRKEISLSLEGRRPGVPGGAR